MSETDNTYECPHCRRSVLNGCQCSCIGAQRFANKAGHPDGPGVEMHSGDLTERDGPEFEPENDN